MASNSEELEYITGGGVKMAQWIDVLVSKPNNLLHGWRKELTPAGFPLTIIYPEINKK